MKTIRKMFNHLHWANKRILKKLQEHDNEEARRLFSHVLCAEQVWLARLQGKDSSQLPIWTEMSLKECEAKVETNEKQLLDYISKLANEMELEGIVMYQNSKGTEFKTSVRDILTHVALHGQYHRGQINMQLRKNHFEPVNVDFITFVR